MSLLVLSVSALVPVALAYHKFDDTTCRYGCSVYIKANGASGNRTICKVEDDRRKTKPPNKKVQFYLPGHHDAQDCRKAWEKRY
jgi:hypothetical protein